MKLNRIFALAALAASPAFASSIIDFETTWAYGTDVDNYYNGGAAADGTTSGLNYGVSFVNVSGLSNDALGPYYSNAPSRIGVAYPHGTAYMNVAEGLANMLSFYYSSPVDVNDAVKAYSGPDGSGSLLGSLNLTANSSTSYDTWTRVTFTYSGIAQSFDLTAGADSVALDNIAVPEPGCLSLILAGSVPLVLRVAGANNRRRKA